MKREMEVVRRRFRKEILGALEGCLSTWSGVRHISRS